MCLSVLLWRRRKYILKKFATYPPNYMDWHWRGIYFDCLFIDLLKMAHQVDSLLHCVGNWSVPTITSRVKSCSGACVSSTSSRRLAIKLNNRKKIIASLEKDLKSRGFRESHFNVKKKQSVVDWRWYRDRENRMKKSSLYVVIWSSTFSVLIILPDFRFSQLGWWILNLLGCYAVSIGTQ